MNIKKTILRVCLLPAILAIQIVSIHAQLNAFTYQGSLKTGGTAVSGFYDFEFDICDAPNQGYIIDESSEIEVLLPSAPQVGDVIRVVETRTGSFSPRLNSGQTIVRSDTDLNAPWVAVESSRDWFTVASSADGTRLAAAELSGRIYTSQDSGKTWVPHETNRSWWRIASSADGTKLVAVVNERGGQIYLNQRSVAASSVAGTSLSSVELIYVGGGKFLLLSSKGKITLY